MHPIRVILADDHPIVRDGIKNLLLKEADIAIVGEAEDGETAFELVKSTPHDILLLDMDMPGMKGYDVIYQLSKENINTKILILSAYADSYYVKSLLEMGVAGYLTKEEAADFIVSAIRGIAEGEHGWISREVTVQLAGLFQADMNKHKGLTLREFEVLEEVACGRTNGDIAVKLGISEKTVEKHLDSIFLKMNVHSRVEAAVQGIRLGWVK